MEVMKELLEKMEKAKNKDRISNLALEEAKTEDVEKLTEINEKLEVYSTLQKLYKGMAKLEDNDLENFVEVLAVSVKFQRTLMEFDYLINTDNLENAENMVEDVQKIRNELAKLTVEFLKI